VKSRRHPVLVGVGQVLQRTDDLEAAKEPLERMVDAVRAAAEDAGSAALLARAGAVRVIRGMWRYGDPGRVVAERIGCPGAKTALTHYGGNYGQTATSLSCLDIQRGDLDVVVLTGAEGGRTWARLSKAGKKTSWSQVPGVPDLTIGDELEMWHEAEMARGIRQPIQVYPILEVALRAADGQGVEEHLKTISELWAGFSAVAVDNPNAWIRERKTAEEIRTIGPDNPPVSFPYPMLMNSNSRGSCTAHPRSVSPVAAVSRWPASSRPSWLTAISTPASRWLFASRRASSASTKRFSSRSRAASRSEAAR
jgi:acetyl-CoA C-acetyltransferase